jgi:hypothetical protein
VAILVGVVVIAAVGAAVGLGLTGGGSGGSGGSDGSAQPPSTPGERRLLAMVPATTRPGCVRGTPEPSAEATIACDVASVLTVSYHLFGSRSTADAWYEQSRVAGGVAAETGSCAGDNFHGQVDYKAGGATVGQYFCLLNDHDQPVIVAHDRRVPVDYPAEVFQGTGRPAAENLLRLWTCCIQLQP